MASLLTYDDLERRFGVDRRTIQRWIRGRGFPRPIDFSPGTMRFNGHEVDVWERTRALRRNGAMPLSESDAFKQLNEALTEATETGDYALEMQEFSERWSDPGEVVHPTTLTELYTAYLNLLADPDTAQATREAMRERPQLAAFLRTFNPMSPEAP
jgi:predicted DNA-binding transcriptional regulator AlpA